MKIRLNAFSFAEISIVVGLLLTTAILCIPFITNKTQEARIISGWKRTFAETKSNFEIFSINDFKAVQTLCRIDDSDRDEELFKIIAPYLNAEFSDKNKDLKFYRYKFFGGAHIPKESIYFTDKLIYQESGSIAGFKWLTCRCTEKEPCATAVFDMNGKKGPNRLGKDVFGVYILKDRIEAFGYDLSNEELKKQCANYGGNGSACSEYYLRGGNF